MIVGSVEMGDDHSEVEEQNQAPGVQQQEVDQECEQLTQGGGSTAAAPTAPQQRRGRDCRPFRGPRWLVGLERPVGLASATWNDRPSCQLAGGLNSRGHRR